MSKKTKKGPHPHDKKEQQQIAGCPRCRGKEIFTVIVPVPALGIGTITTSSESPEALAAATFVTGKTLHATDRVDAERIADENPGVLVTYPPIPDTSDLAPLEVLPLSSVPLEAEPVAPLAPPGSQSALDAGCSCPVIDNEHGRGYHYVPGKEATYVTFESCQIHGGTTAPDAPAVAPVGFSPH
jgi:hypothetical protein